MSKIIDAKKAIFTERDKILFDCNVLMYMFYTYGGYSKSLIRNYTSLFNNAIQNKSMIVIPSIEVSEFINTYCRQEYKRYERYLRQENKADSRPFDFKHDYKATKEYEYVIKEIHSIVNNQILKIFYKLDDVFSEIDISSIYDKPNEFDFNDRYYLKLAEKEGIKIITNDEDFYSDLVDVEIITANKKLLRKNSV